MARRFVDELLEVCKDTLSHLPPKEARALALAIRQRWGGSEVYVDKATAQHKAERLGEELAKGTPIKQAIKKAGVSRASGYRVLSRKWIVRPE
jgi:Mor family transcriptional regulator